MSDTLLNLTDRFTAPPEPGRTRWTPLRIGLANVWLYDDKEFWFHDGRMLLRGSNGSGKSVVLEVVLPFLFEADINPTKMGTMGGRARSLRYKMIEFEGCPDETRTGYIWAEYGRLAADGTPEYFTVGVGVQATRGVQHIARWWWTSRIRPGIDVDLTPNDVPLSQSALEDALGDHGTVYGDDATSYKHHINQTLYGFEPSRYDGMVESQRTLRKPKLSEGLNDRVVSTTLRDANRPVAESRLQDLASGLENIERIERTTREVEAAAEALDEFAAIYKDYVTRLLRERADALITTRTARDEAVTAAEAAETAHSSALDRLAEAQQTVADLGLRRRELAATLEALLSSSAYTDKAPELDRRVADAKRAAERAERARTRAQHEAEQAAIAARQATSADQDASKADETARTAAIETLRAADEISARPVHERLQTPDPEDTLRAVRGWIKTREADVSDVETAQQAVIEATAARNAAAATATDREADLERATTAVGDTEDAYRTAAEQYATTAEQWLTALTTITVTVDAYEPDTVAASTARAVAAVREHASRNLGRIAEQQQTATEERAKVAARRDTVAATTEQHPDSPTWRQGRTGAGAPLYLTVAPRQPDDAAIVESVLEHAGLLDAWVSNDGTVDLSRLDIAIADSAPTDGPTLADVVDVDPETPVPTATVERILRSIRWVDTVDPTATDGQIGRDGTFRLGHAAGRVPVRDETVYLGAAARRAARERTLADLEQQIADLDERLADLDRQQAAENERVAVAEREAAGAPARTSYDQAQRAHTEAVAERRRAADALTAARDALTAAIADLDQANDAVATIAADRHLAGWTDRLSVYRNGLAAYHHAVSEWRSATVNARNLRKAAGEAATRAEATAVTASDAAAEATDAAAEAAAANTAAETFRATVGAEVEQVHAEIADVRNQQARNERDLTAATAAHTAAVKRETAAEKKRDDTDAAAKALEATYQDAIDTLLEALQSRGDLAGVAGIDLPDDVDAAADRIVSALKSAGSSRARRDALREARPVVAAKLLQLQNLHVKLHHGDDSDVLDLLISSGDREMTLPQASQDLIAKLELQRRLLTRERAETFERALTDDFALHLHELIAGLTETTQQISDLISRFKTGASQLQVRVKWRIRDDLEAAPEDLADVVNILLNPPHLWDATGSDRTAVQTFFRDYLAALRANAGDTPWIKVLTEALDYRQWFDFELEARQAGQTTWKSFGASAHAGKSGGEKSVTLHLVLFAAIAVHYNTSPVGGPRLIGLDEAFSGVSPDNQQEMFAVAADLDLDMLMTSESIDPCYPTVAGISIYDLWSDQAEQTVTLERIMWDGADRHEMIGSDLLAGRL